MTGIASLRARLRRLEQRSPAEPLVVCVLSRPWLEPWVIRSSLGSWERQPSEDAERFQRRALDDAGSLAKAHGLRVFVVVASPQEGVQ